MADEDMDTELNRYKLKCEQYQRQLDDRWEGVTAITNKALEDVAKLEQERADLRAALEQAYADLISLESDICLSQAVIRATLDTLIERPASSEPPHPGAQ